MSWFVLALISPLLFAITNLIDDHMLRHVYRSPHSGAIVSSLFAGIPLFSLFFYDLQDIPLNLAVLSLLAGFLLSMMYYNYFRSFEEEPPSVIVAVIGINPIILGILGYLFLDEKLYGIQILGGILVLFCSILLVVKKKEKFIISSSLKHLVLALLLISMYSFITKYLYDKQDFYTVYMHVCAGIVMGGVLLIFFLIHADRKYVLRDLRKSFRKFLPIFLITELIAILAEFIGSLAVSKGPVSIVRSVENIQPVYVLLIAIALYPFYPKFFREAAEGDVRRKLVLLVGIVIGLALIASSV